MRTTTLVAVLAAAVTATTALGAPSVGIAPHVYSTSIKSGAPAHFHGTWLLTIRQATFRVAQGSSLAVSGSVKIAGNRITFRDLGGPLACPGAQHTGVYTWRVVGSNLRMTAIKDLCVGRKTILTKPFTRIL
jgi:hypothetical protein